MVLVSLRLRGGMNSRPYGEDNSSPVRQVIGQGIQTCRSTGQHGLGVRISASKSEPGKRMKKAIQFKKVVSASRRVDLVSFYPDYMVERLEEIGAENIHSLVVWTKNPQNMLVHPGLRKILKELNHIYVLLTVTGLGGTALEPQAPTRDWVFERLPRIIDFVKSPRRVAIRYDPLIDVINQEKTRISNIDVGLFEDVLNRAHTLGIERVIVSYVTVYGKVKKRLEQNGFKIVEHPIEEMVDFIRDEMIPRVEKLGMELLTCVLPNLTTTGCIDGAILRELHPQEEACSLAKDRSQRENCHCTKSIDIGQWFACYHNCLYCYGNPARRFAPE
jgi:dihydroneopterin aldolase